MFPICNKFVGTILSFGLDVTSLNTNTTVHDGKLVIVLSKSGENDESLYLLEHLKKRDVVIWR